VTPRAAPAEPPLLEVDDLRVDFAGDGSTVHAVRGVSLDLRRGETVGIVGESGSGKSVFARSVMGLTTLDRGAVVSGRVALDGTDLTALGPRDLRQHWGTDVAMVFQDPLASLNPVRTIGAHLRVPLRLHLGLSRRQAMDRSRELLDLVRISEPERRLKQYAHELSGGMRQRVMIALAVSCQPKLLIADEPTTALDVTVQRQVLDLVDQLAVDLRMGTLLITHDLSVVAGRADRIAVMYAGRIVELAPTADIFERPRHHYTEALLGSIPSLHGDRARRLRSIPGSPPDLRRPDAGCAFRSRCPAADERCAAETPRLAPPGPGGAPVACHHPLAGPLSGPGAPGAVDRPIAQPTSTGP